MCTSKRTTFLLAGVLAIASHALASDDDPQAKQLLLKVLNRQSDHNVRALVWQLIPGGRNEMMQFTIDISRSGKSRQIITAPLTMSKVQAVDDLSKSYNYYPTQRLLVVQDSARKTDCDADYRLRLAERNYTLKLTTSGTRVAGQAATLVTATPRNGSLETRRFYIDSKTGFLLKLETVYGGDTTLRLETKNINYPASVSESTFVLDVPSGTRTQTYRRPEQFSGQSAIAKIGFTPVAATRGASLPMGFVVQDVQISDRENVKQVIVRITDGLVSGRVYQMPVQKEPIGRIRSVPDVSAQDAGSIRIIVSADIPSRARDELLRYFVSRVQSNAEPMAWGRLVLAEIGPELDAMPLALVDSKGLSVGQAFDVAIPSGNIALRPDMATVKKLTIVSQSGDNR